MHNTLNKKERLCSKKTIDNLFANNNSFFSHPFVVKWQLHNDPQEYPAQLLIIVPKRKLRHAVDRNRTKRLIRECYRVQKQRLYDILQSNECKLRLALIYVDTKTPLHTTLMEKTAAVLQKLNTAAEQHKNPEP